jgi:hypothetical protein
MHIYCGGVKWSAPEKSPDLTHAEHTLAVRAGNSYSCTEDFVYIRVATYFTSVEDA